MEITMLEFCYVECFSSLCYQTKITENLTNKTLLKILSAEDSYLLKYHLYTSFDQLFSPCDDF